MESSPLGFPPSPKFTREDGVSGVPLLVPSCSLWTKLGNGVSFFKCSQSMFQAAAGRKA